MTLQIYFINTITTMKTLWDYILDMKRKEERFLSEPTSAPRIPIITKGTAQNVNEVIQPNYVTPDGIPCHNKATVDFYSRNK